MATQTKAENPPAEALSPAGKFEIELREQTPKFQAALPDHIPPAKFERALMTAINNNNDLMTADRRSLFNSCVMAAQDGLLPDGREAALVIFNTKVKVQGKPDQWIKKVQYMPMVAGLRKRMRNSGDVASAEAHVVYQNDHFDYELGDTPHIAHKPEIGDRGEAVAAYAIIKLTNGEVLRVVMSLDDIETVRAVSKAAKNGPWVTWWGEMARKTVLRRCAKAAPMQSDRDELLLKRDEALERDEPRDITPAPARPARVDYTWAGTIILDEGEVDEFTDEGSYLDAFEMYMGLAGSHGRDQLRTFWEQNSAGLPDLAASGHEQQVQDLRDLFTTLDAAAIEAQAEAKRSAATASEKQADVSTEPPNGGGADESSAGSAET
ncbi:hypothetical protein LCGC14_1839810, partial [marine sediment metagenome]